MRRGRPTSDPKSTLLAVRLAERHVRFLQDRAERGGVSLSEALRLVLEESISSPPPPPTTRRPTAEERAMFDELFGAFGMVRSRRRRRPRR